MMALSGVHFTGRKSILKGKWSDKTLINGNVFVTLFINIQQTIKIRFGKLVKQRLFPKNMHFLLDVNEICSTSTEL